MKKKYFYYSFMVSVVICVSALFISCGSGPGDFGLGATAQIGLDYYYSCERELRKCVPGEPYPIPADGTSSIRIKATLTDGSGDPVYILTPVTFSTTLGHFPNGAKSYSTRTITYDPCKIEPSTVETALIAGTTSGVAFITCSSNGVTQADYVVFTDYDAVDVRGETAAITLQFWDPIEEEPIDTPSIPADGISSLRIKATLTDSTEEPVEMGTYVSFHTDSGKFANNSVTYTVHTPNQTGVVMVSFIAGTGGEKANVCAYSNGVSQCIAVEYTRVE